MGHARTDILLTAMKSQPVSMPAGGRGASVAYVIDPRFPGGTSSAVAQELRVVSDLVKPRVFGISSGMFRGETVAPQLETALQELGLTLEWDPPKITADVVIVHNPAFLKFQNELPTRILAGRIFVVTHENLIRPTGAEAFDVASCLGLIGNSTLALERYIAPISPYNRSTVRNWFDKSAQSTDWKILPEDWFNICDFEMQSPTASPLDRRGRLSRPGFEKFPRLEDLELCFPPAAQSNVLLGADCLMGLQSDYPHWHLVPFRGMETGQFFESIDFMVYFTSSAWRESFGRVLAEGIAAGKVVISDAATASTFGGAVIAATPAEVGGVIAGLVERPDRYRRQVEKAQKKLGEFSAEAFGNFFRARVEEWQGCRT